MRSTLCCETAICYQLVIDTAGNRDPKCSLFTVRLMLERMSWSRTRETLGKPELGQVLDGDELSGASLHTHSKCTYSSAATAKPHTYE